MPTASLAVIGGSGFYHMEGIADVEEVAVATPFGDPSDAITVGTLEGERVAFLPRHGRGHRISPTELNQRANIFALKTLGVEQIISISACGSMREEIRPLDAVIPDQIFDRTLLRPNTFFGEGLVVHVGFADPFCPELSRLLFDVAAEVLGDATADGTPDGEPRPPRAHRGGTYVCIEGPQFSTKAESRIYRRWGVDLIGMTVLPEAKLAREAEICYATLAFATDYDVWHESAAAVSVEMVVENLFRNVAAARQIIRSVVGQARRERRCGCESALESAIITQRDAIPPEIKAKLAPLIGRYV